jgi:hypothetical protein
MLLMPHFQIGMNECFSFKNFSFFSQGFFFLGLNISFGVNKANLLHDASYHYYSLVEIYLYQDHFNIL